jgi:hypothetical protein
MPVSLAAAVEAARHGATNFGYLNPGDKFRFLSGGSTYTKGKGSGWFTDDATGKAYRTSAGSMVLHVFTWSPGPLTGPLGTTVWDSVRGWRS